MAGRLSFSIAINLLTENFKRGTNQVKTALRSMQMQFLTFAAALGAGGLGLSGFVSQLITVARETSRVITALKNVSGSMSQFADNQRYLLDMANKYGLEINALTGNYAKFTAASQVSGMSMDNQRKIFESMSRACTAFGMSADDSNGVFLALSQMMSKGKISSEELRLQMGERLPIALQAMAKAAGVSVGGLDKLMKQGKLMSADVLPKFADAINEMIPNVDTDNLETSVNRLKNAFTDFVNGTDAQSKYKALIDGLTGAVKGAAENIKNIVVGVVAIIVGAVANGAMKLWTSISGTATQLEAVALRSNATLIAATNNRIAAEIALEKVKVAANNATGAAALAARQRVIQAQNALATASVTEQIAIENVKEAELKILDAQKISNAQKTAGVLAAITRQRVAAEIGLEEAKTGVITANSAQILAAQQRLATAQTTLAKITAKEISAQEAVKAAAAQAASVKSATWWGTACTRMTAAGAKLVASLRTMWASFAPMIIITAIIALWGYFKNLREEAERIRKVFSDYKRESESVSHSPEIIQLKVIRDLYNKAADGSKLKEKYQNRIIELLGGELKKNQDINDAIRERVQLLEATAKADFYTRKKIEAQDELNSMYNKRGGEKAFNFQFGNAMANRGNVNFGGESSILYEFEQAVNLKKIIADADANIYKYSEYVEKNKPITGPINTINDPDKKEKQTELQKLEEKHAQSLRELSARREVEKMSIDDYNKAYDGLKKSALIEAKSSTEKNVLTSQYIQGLQKAVDNPLYGSVQAELSKVESDYKKATELAKAKLDKKIISEDEYRQSLIDAATAAANSAISIENIGDAADGFIKKMQGVVGVNLKIDMPKLKQRDATFDYKKTKTDKTSEKLDVWIEYRDNLKDKLKETKDKTSDVAKSLEIELNGAIANVDDLGKALKLSQVQEDIKNFSKELGDMQWDGIKGAVSNIDGMVSAFQRLQDAFDPESEATEWERLMAVWNMMTSVVDGMMSVIDTIKNITELTNKLTQAKDTEATMDTATTAIKATNAVTETTAEATALATQTTTAVAASGAKTTAATTAMAAESTAAYAAIPFVGVALAGAQIAAMKAMIMAAAIPFAKGGIITRGASSGDRTLARVNAGEMILNGTQQANLFDAINSGRLGGSGGVASSVTTKIRSKDLILIINNELKSQGKKPIS